MSQFWPCARCAGAGRVKPAAWGPDMAAAGNRAELETHGDAAGPACRSCGGAGILDQASSVGVPVPCCPECLGFGRIVQPRRPPYAAHFVTAAEACHLLELTFRELHHQVDRGALTPALRRGRWYVFSRDALLPGAATAAATVIEGGTETC